MKWLFAAVIMVLSIACSQNKNNQNATYEPSEQQFLDPQTGIDTIEYFQTWSKSDSLLLKSTNNLLVKISKSSISAKDICTSQHAKSIIDNKSKILPFLFVLFDDKTKSDVYSSCNEDYLTRGEIAIILADKIVSMPYCTLTGVQNCTLEFCPDSPNRIEYYFSAIRRDPIEKFQQKYLTYLIEDGFIQ